MPVIFARNKTFGVTPVGIIPNIRAVNCVGILQELKFLKYSTSQKCTIIKLFHIFKTLSIVFSCYFELATARFCFIETLEIKIY